MKRKLTRRRRRSPHRSVVHIAFYLVSANKNASHLIDAVGIACLVVVAITFRTVHWKTGIWKLTHSKSSALDERELSLTHRALSDSYAWFTVICLVIMLAQSVISRLNVCISYTITVPLVVSLIYLAHTLPSSIISWTEADAPREIE